MLCNYSLIFYTDNKGKSPITDFLDNCDERLRSKILRQFMYAREFGLTPKIPNIKKLAGSNFWELRILGKDNVRIFCLGRENNVHIIHIFAKKKQKTPKKEINIAIQRLLILDN